MLALDLLLTSILVVTVVTVVTGLGLGFVNPNLSAAILERVPASEC